MFLTDDQIAELLREPKRFPEALRAVPLTWSNKPRHAEVAAVVEGAAGRFFEVRVRRLLADPLDFSVIVGVKSAAKDREIEILKRYNGPHPHTNQLERDRIHDFHIHVRTERYQQAGLRAEGFATATALFRDVESAVRLMLGECGFVDVDDQPGLFT